MFKSFPYIFGVSFSLLFASTSLATEQSPLEPSSNTKTMLLFDASGSMWGQLEGKPKIDIARETLSSVLSTWNEQHDLGVMVYGHRRKGDCDDIETIFPVSKPDTQKISAQLKQISPKGKTPISRSLNKAADALKFTEDKATIILISDGKETCDADPCGAAKKLEAQGIDFTAHVIGFDVDKETDAQLRCIAESTGGRYFPADDASELNSAITQVSEITQEPPAPQQQTLRLNAKLKLGTQLELLTHDLRWSVKQGDEVLHEESEARPELTLEEGDYQLSLYHKNSLLIEQTLHVKKDMDKDVVLIVSGGELVLKAQRQEGSDLITESVNYWIRDNEGDRITNKTTPQFQTILMPGTYTIEAKFQGVSRTHTLEIKPGETTEHIFVMGGMGTLALTASETENSEPIKVSFQIRTETGKHVSSKTNTKWSDELPAGKYLVSARYHRQEASAELEVKPDEETNYQFVLGQRGLMRLTTVDDAGKTMRVSYQIRRKADGQNMSSRKERVWERRLLPDVYQVTVFTTWKDERHKLEREFEVKPGETIDETFTLPFSKEGATQ